MSDELRDALRSVAAGANRRAARPPVTELRKRLVQRRVRVGTGFAVVASLTATLSAVALDRLVRADGNVPAPLVASETPTPSPSASPSPSVSPAPISTDVPPPPTIVAAPEDTVGVFQMLSAQTGNVMRTVDINNGEGPVDPVVSSDRKTIYFSRIQTSCTNEIVAVPTGGGDERVLPGSGWSIAVSPDEHHIAYVTRVECFGDYLVVVRDLRTGADRQWTWGRGAKPDTHSVFGLAWAPDSRHLAYIREVAERPQPSPGEINREVMVLDTEGPGTSLDAGRSVYRSQLLYSVDQVVYRPSDGQLLVVEWECCSLGDHSRVTEIDRGTGENRQVMRFDDGVRMIDFDSSGQHVIYVTREFGLYRWNDGHPVKLADHVYGADW